MTINLKKLWASGLPASLDLHISSNLKLILGSRYLVSYREIKYLESNLVCMNARSLPVDKQHDITSEISEKKDKQKDKHTK